MTPDQLRRVRAKRLNEGIKLTATLLNNMAVGLFVGGLVAPNAAGRSLDPLWYAALNGAAAQLHLVGRVLLWSLRSEERAMDPLFIYGFPLGALLIGAIAVAFCWFEGRAFDRDYPDAKGEKVTSAPVRHRPL